MGTKKTCYIVHFYLGERQHEIERFYSDRFCHLRAQIDTLEKYKHNLTKIIFNINVEPEHYEYLSEFIKLTPRHTQNSEIEINIRENFGLSYISFLDIFNKYSDEFAYYIFNEDDYVFVQDNFDEYLVNKFNSLQNCGYFCGIIREPHYYDAPDYIKHGAMSSGISSFQCLKKGWSEHLKQLNYLKSKEYYNSEKYKANAIKFGYYGKQHELFEQIEHTNSLVRAGYEIYDIREEYRMQFWYEKLHKYFMWNDKDLFLPTKLYYNEACDWDDRIDKQYLRMENNRNSNKYYDYWK